MVFSFLKIRSGTQKMRGADFPLLNDGILLK